MTKHRMWKVPMVGAALGVAVLLGGCGSSTGSDAASSAASAAASAAQSVAESAAGSVASAAESAAASAGAAASSAVASAGESVTGNGAFTMAQVAEHATSGDCWTAIDGKVYDLTDWEDQHPGGAARIVSLCGTDGTSAFSDQHGSQSEPNETLAQYQIGVLVP